MMIIIICVRCDQDDDHHHYRQQKTYTRSNKTVAGLWLTKLMEWSFNFLNLLHFFCSLNPKSWSKEASSMMVHKESNIFPSIFLVWCAAWKMNNWFCAQKVDDDENHDCIVHRWWRWLHRTWTMIVTMFARFCYEPTNKAILGEGLWLCQMWECLTSTHSWSLMGESSYRDLTPC